MKNLAFSLVAFVATSVTGTAFAILPPVFINEFHYDNSGTDVGEFIEIAGLVGTDLSGWSIVLYDGSTTHAYRTNMLGGVIPVQVANYGTVVVSYPTNGIQNGPQDGIALVDGFGAIVQFLSYEGVLTATDGVAMGVTSTDIGVFESGTDPAGKSLQMIGTGFENFFWASGPGDDSPGSVNYKEIFGTAPLYGDYNNNGSVDAADYVVWRKNENTMNQLPNDPNGGAIGAAQYNTWRANFGQTFGSGSGAYTNTVVPEPATTALILLALHGSSCRRARRI